MGRQFIVVFVPPAVVIKLSYTVGKSHQELEAKLKEDWVIYEKGGTEHA